MKDLSPKKHFKSIFSFLLQKFNMSYMIKYVFAAFALFVIGALGGVFVNFVFKKSYFLFKDYDHFIDMMKLIVLNIFVIFVAQIFLTVLSWKKSVQLLSDKIITDGDSIYFKDITEIIFINRFTVWITAVDNDNQQNTEIYTNGELSEWMAILGEINKFNPKTYDIIYYLRKYSLRMKFTNSNLETAYKNCT